MGSHMKYLLSLVLMSATVLSAASTPDHITSDSVLAHVTSVGAKQAVIDYYAKPEWIAIKHGIASGSDGWLKVYVALNSVADGEAGEDLGEAISDALPVRPFKVLPILANNGQYKVEQLCTLTFEAKIPAGGINAYLTHLERSLRKASGQSERTMADSCRRGVNVTRNTFKSSPDY